MKAFLVIFALLAIVGCEAERRYEWVVERHGRPAADIQADFDTLGKYGWQADDDDDLETSGFYVYFVKIMTPSHAAHELQTLTAELKVGRQVR